MESNALEQKPTVLIIEDDATINDVVHTYLSKKNFNCTQAFSGSEARLVLDGSSAGNFFDLIITDLMLPGLSGKDIVSLVRDKQVTTPIIVISAQDTPSEKIELLGLGADDYLTKPFDLDELYARIQVQLRHTSARIADVTTSPLTFKDWAIDCDSRSLFVLGNPVKLTRIEFNILQTLLRYPKKVFTKQELFESAWNEECFIEEKAINVHMSNIRSKLKSSGTDTYIETVWGIGFKLIDV